MLGALGLLLVIVLAVLLLYVVAVRPLYLAVRWVTWRASGAVAGDELPEPVPEQHPRYRGRWVAAPDRRHQLAHHPFALTDGGRTLVSAEDGGSFSRWDTVTAEPIDRFPVDRDTSGLSMAVSPDGSLLADQVGLRRFAARIYPLPAADRPATFDVELVHPSAVVDAWLSANNAQYADCEIEIAELGFAATTAFGQRPLVVVSEWQSVLGTEPGPGAFVVRTYDAARTGVPLLSESLHPARRAQWHTRAVVLSPDTRLLAIGPADTADGHVAEPVEVIEVATGRIACRLAVDAGIPLAFSPDARLLVCARRRADVEEGWIRPRIELSVWDVPQGRRRSRWTDPRALVAAAAVTDGPDAVVAVGAGYEQRTRYRDWRGASDASRSRNSVVVCRVEDGGPLDDLPVHARRLAFTAGHHLVVSGPGGVTVWDVANS